MSVSRNPRPFWEAGKPVKDSTLLFLPVLLGSDIPLIPLFYWVLVRDPALGLVQLGRAGARARQVRHCPGCKIEGGTEIFSNQDTYCFSAIFLKLKINSKSPQ